MVTFGLPTLTELDNFAPPKKVPAPRRGTQPGPGQVRQICLKVQYKTFLSILPTGNVEIFNTEADPSDDVPEFFEPSQACNEIIRM
jgi:hypothetical protein